MFRNEDIISCATRKVSQETGIIADATDCRVLASWGTVFPTSAWGPGTTTHTVNATVLCEIDEEPRIAQGDVRAAIEETAWRSPGELVEDEAIDAYVKETLRDAGFAPTLPPSEITRTRHIAYTHLATTPALAADIIKPLAPDVPHAMLCAARVVVIAFDASQTHLLLANRHLGEEEPSWALPETYIARNESFMACTHRELSCSTGLLDLSIFEDWRVRGCWRTGGNRDAVTTVVTMTCKYEGPGQIGHMHWFPVDALLDDEEDGLGTEGLLFSRCWKGGFPILEEIWEGGGRV